MLESSIVSNSLFTRESYICTVCANIAHIKLLQFTNNIIYVYIAVDRNHCSENI